MNLENTLIQWLKSLNIKIPYSKIEEILLQHPDYPSAFSITETLSIIGIKSDVFEIKNAQLSEITAPYLVHLAKNGGEFQVIQKNPFSEVHDFENLWTKIVVVVDTEYLPTDPGLIKNQPQVHYTVWMGILLILINIFFLRNNLNQYNIGLSLISWAGILLSYFTVSKGLGIYHNTANTFCDGTTCDDIIDSKSMRLPFGMQMSDLSLVWFGSLYVINIGAIFLNSFQEIYLVISYLSIFGIVAVLFSLSYQAYLKKWCKLCLATAALLTAQFILLYPITVTLQIPHLPALAFSILPLVLISMIWLPIKQMISEKIISRFLKFRSDSFKFREDVFFPLIERQESFSIKEFSNEIYLGDKVFPLQITLVNSLFCEPCATSFKTLEKFFADPTVKFGIKIRFLLRHADETNSKGQVVRFIINILVTNKTQEFRLRALKDWYENRDFSKYKFKYNDYYSPANEEAVQSLIEDFQSFTLLTETHATPTFFVNEWKLPKSYSVEDLDGISRYCLREIEDKISS